MEFAADAGDKGQPSGFRRWMLVFGSRSLSAAEASPTARSLILERSEVRAVAIRDLVAIEVS